MVPGLFPLLPFGHERRRDDAHQSRHTSHAAGLVPPLWPNEPPTG
jgi:hypothetical protein